MTDFHRLLEAEIPSLRRYARALTKKTTISFEDVLQECLVRAVAKQGLWTTSINLRAWLFVIMHNQFINMVRLEVREREHSSTEEMASVLYARTKADGSLIVRDLEAALEQLPLEQRQAILLAGLEGLSYEEAAEVAGVPVGTIRSRLCRGRTRLRRLMDG